VSTILAIDPGTVISGWCVLGAAGVVASGVADNGDLLVMVQQSSADRLAIEMIASYGMPVGREVFETCVWIGRYLQAWAGPEAVELVYRKDVKMHLCGTPRAKDPNVRQALLDMFPATGGGKTPQIGIQSKPGPLFGVVSHAWAALAVAVTATKWETA
jgi:hypothetical protein